MAFSKALDFSIFDSFSDDLFVTLLHLGPGNRQHQFNIAVKEALYQAHLLKIVVERILLPMASWLTTSKPEMTRPKKVYSPFRNKESFLTMKNWESLDTSLGVAWRATPTAPAVNASEEVSVGKVELPPVPSPFGSQP